MKCKSLRLIIKDEDDLRQKYGTTWLLAAFQNAYKISDERILAQNGKSWQIVNCGKCEPCIINQKTLVNNRAEAEFYKYKQCYFITLTFNNETIKDEADVRHPQNFIKYFKKIMKLKAKDLGYLYCSEFGDRTKRLHYHMVIYCNLTPTEMELEFLKKTKNGNYYTSKLIERCWLKRGFCLIAIGNEYVSKYLTKYTMKSDWKVRWNLYQMELQQRRYELDRAGIKGFEKYRLVDEVIQNNRERVAYKTFIKYSHGLGFVNYERKNLSQLNTYYLKKYLMKKYGNIDYLKCPDNDDVLDHYKKVRHLANTKKELEWALIAPPIKKDKL